MSKKNPNRTVSPQPKIYSVSGPQSLKREVSSRQQTDMREEILLWGPDNGLPLRILEAIEASPTATSCLDVVTDFIAGNGFSDKGLEEIVIDEDGTTLRQLNDWLADYVSKMEGFSTNFKFDNGGRILSTYVLPIENNRFKKPASDTDRDIKKIHYNPYYGTELYKQDQTCVYDILNLKEVLKQYGEQGNDYKGQVYFYGSTRALYKFYPVPKYWSGKHWIYTDGKISEFHDTNLDNGFFQSVMLTMIGNPDQKSNHPDDMKEIVGEDGNKRKEPNGTTIAQRFDKWMSENFSGSKRAGTAIVQWAQSIEKAPQIQNFPTNTNIDLLSGTFLDTIRGITIATKVPAILANLPQQASSLGSDGNSFQKAVELMQSRTIRQRAVLENFYNNILLPNMQKPVKQKVKIMDFKPVSVSVTMEDKFWKVIPPESQLKYVVNNIPGVEVPEGQTVPVEPALDENGEPLPIPAKPNEALKNLNIEQLNRIQKIVARYQLSTVDPGNAKALTYDQAKQMLLSFGFTDTEMDAWLVKPEEL